MCREKYSAKGEMIFLYTKKGIISKTRDFKDENEKHFGQKTIYHLYDGKDFLKEVENGCIIDYDGEILNIFVNGYISNLGLHHEGLSQGRFLIDKETFLELCEEYEIKVNWANK